MSKKNKQTGNQGGNTNVSGSRKMQVKTEKEKR